MRCEPAVRSVDSLSVEAFQAAHLVPVHRKNGCLQQGRFKKCASN
jgi:hypothetical protein